MQGTKQVFLLPGETFQGPSSKIKNKKKILFVYNVCLRLNDTSDDDNNNDDYDHIYFYISQAASTMIFTIELYIYIRGRQGPFFLLWSGMQLILKNKTHLM
jgi:hypothetical protein